ncbi:DUF3093 domain-containing protein [Corynebacterium lowii]|uniref:DUF3093 domain-containing protein n=1 Tax=Corynebacterium lowii TaxID=1544413 RepID=A0A0Q0UJU9_9CORY|nr:DUF3093 domain-containing protein [Corynebacterium lowii]KQB86523.1 hypothetical protein Clow_00731 [Corynebacterium lowii]MDP9851203.1 hypothetical protein [Corynebacterium lowii]
MIDSASPARTVLYRERQWVPAYWWILAFGLVALLTAQIAHNRSTVWLIAPAIVFSLLAVWLLTWLSSTVIQVERDEHGVRWLLAGGAILPDNVVDRSLAVPATAKRNAMGLQLDPAAFVVSHGWVPEMVMIVLDDPEDPTPYWLIGSKNPEALLAAFLPEKQGSEKHSEERG